jgi:hypothetical protein
MKSKIAARCSLKIFNPDPGGYKKCITMWLGVTYDFQATNRKQGGLPVRTHHPRQRIAIGRLGVVYDSQPAGIHKNTSQTGGCSYFSMEKSLKTTSFQNKNL